MTKRQFNNNMRSIKKQVNKLSKEYLHLHTLAYPYGGFTYIHWIHIRKGRVGKLRMLQDEKHHYKDVIKELKELLYG